MPRTGVTREQVFDAAEALLLEGQNPTVMAIRARLGGGSPNTITPLLAEWRSMNESRKAADMPPVPDQVDTVLRQVWGMAWKRAQEQLEAEREALGTARKEIDKERTEMLAEIARLDTALEEGRATTKELTATLETERRTHDQTRAEVGEARALATEREQRIAAQDAELKDLRQRVESSAVAVSRLEADLTQAREQADAAREEARSHRDALQTHQRKLQESVRQAETSTMRADQLEQHLDSARERAKETKAIVDASGKRIQRLESALEEERREHAATGHALADARAEIAGLTERAGQVEPLRKLLDRLGRNTKG